jgi:hypothetical protein
MAGGKEWKWYVRPAGKLFFLSLVTLCTVKPDSLNLEYATHNQGKRRIQVKIEYTIDSKSVVFRVFIPG